DGVNYLRNYEIVKSIRSLKIPLDKYEIIIVGGVEWLSDDVKWIPFDERKGPKAWITKKKNIAFKIAKHKNISIAHDYISYDIDWYKNFLEFDKNNPKWDEVVCRIENSDGSRFRDWVE